MTRKYKQYVAKISKLRGRKYAIESVMVTEDISRECAKHLVLNCEEITPEQVDITADRIIQRGLR